MADESVSSSQGQAGDSERAGFCQDCGRPLTASTIRMVGSGVFCEPCLERRVSGVPNANSRTAGREPISGAGTSPGPTTPGSFGSSYPPPNGVFPPLDGSTPHPVLAGFLGLIPGVGAMYNGQFAKGIVHLIVFAVLVSLADNVNGIFGLLVAGWIFFMAFEAYHTAQARRAGLPLPDPFGWNNIGERLGLRNWSPASSTPGSQQAYKSPDWVGYVPPTDFATTPDAGSSGGVAPPVNIPVPPSSMADYASQYAKPAAASTSPWPDGEPYASYTASAYQPPYATVPSSADVNDAPITGIRRFPVGAVWLIALGVIFLVGNISPDLRLSGRWMLPIFLAAIAIWMFVRRLGWAGGRWRNSANLVCALRAPVLLMTLAVLFALQSAHLLTLGQTWPVLVIAFGGMLLLERSIGTSGYSNYAPYPGTAPVSAPDLGNDTGSDHPVRWSATTEASAKGGQ